MRCCFRAVLRTDLHFLVPATHAYSSSIEVARRADRSFSMTLYRLTFRCCELFLCCFQSDWLYITLVAYGWVALNHPLQFNFHSPDVSMYMSLLGPQRRYYDLITHFLLSSFCFVSCYLRLLHWAYHFNYLKIVIDNYTALVRTHRPVDY